MEGILWDLLYPKRCVVCDRVLRSGEYGTCRYCKNLPGKILECFCITCGRPLSGERILCSRCEKKKHTFYEGRSAFVYDRAMKRSMKRFKYEGRQEYAGYYGSVLYELFGRTAEAWGADALVPVPLHKERLRKRGYNQAALLAREFGKKTGIPVYEEMLFRTKKTAPQKELSDKERLKNLYHAFSINKEVWELSKRINCVIIMDDIYTTGSTIEACSRTLKTFGIQKICFLCVCTGQGD